MRLWSFALALLLAGHIVPGDPAAAQGNESRASGEWTGRYVCKQGVTGLRLLLDVNGENATAVFHFFGLPENPRVPEGCYTMAGAFSPGSGNLTLTGVKWIRSPGRNFVMVGIQGAIDSDGKNLSGNVLGAPNCTLVVLTRQPSSRPLPAACAAGMR